MSTNRRKFLRNITLGASALATGLPESRAQYAQKP
ncbi:MAG TPA: hypothetical protein DCO78_15425, partial [Chitinophagaceae bacterium]|nr:hypothetical protein [Chitinophagaceae bacterium]